jgi:hypothetical protein
MRNPPTDGSFRMAVFTRAVIVASPSVSPVLFTPQAAIASHRTQITRPGTALYVHLIIVCCLTVIGLGQIVDVDGHAIVK